MEMATKRRKSDPRTPRAGIKTGSRRLCKGGNLKACGGILKKK